jgi:hypothetical protein
MTIKAVLKKGDKKITLNDAIQVRAYINAGYVFESGGSYSKETGKITFSDASAQNFNTNPNQGGGEPK